MQKLILDTNVIVSALISDSIPSILLYEYVLQQKVKICLSKEIFSEYLDVLSRDKFSRFTDFKNKADIVLNRISEIATFYPINKQINILSDKSDNKFLELAFACSADYLITGNIIDFTISKFEKTTILTPRQYWDNFAPISYE